MKVYIVVKEWSDEKTLNDYYEIIGAFSSKEKAEEARDGAWDEIESRDYAWVGIKCFEIK